MATAVYEQRTFTNNVTGEIIKYDYYGVIGVVNGETMELPLKTLNAAEKLAFKIVATGENVTTGGDVSVRKAVGDEKVQFDSSIEKKSDSEEKGDGFNLFD